MKNIYVLIGFMLVIIFIAVFVFIMVNSKDALYSSINNFSELMRVT